jgi:hypothetical protein
VGVDFTSGNEAEESSNSEQILFDLDTETSSSLKRKRKSKKLEDIVSFSLFLSVLEALAVGQLKQLYSHLLMKVTQVFEFLNYSLFLVNM